MVVDTPAYEPVNTDLIMRLLNLRITDGATPRIWCPQRACANGPARCNLFAVFVILDRMPMRAALVRAFAWRFLAVATVRRRDSAVSMPKSRQDCAVGKWYPNALHLDWMAFLIRGLDPRMVVLGEMVHLRCSSMVNKSPTAATMSVFTDSSEPVWATNKSSINPRCWIRGKHVCM